MSNESQTATGDPALVDSLRRERDRFVALAFCAADILIEVDTEASITYAAGASKALIGAQPEALVGTSFSTSSSTGTARSRARLSAA